METTGTAGVKPRETVVSGVTRRERRQRWLSGMKSGGRLRPGQRVSFLF